MRKDFRSCVRDCNATRDQTRAGNNIARKQIRVQFGAEELRPILPLLINHQLFGVPHRGKAACRRTVRKGSPFRKPFLIFYPEAQPQEKVFNGLDGKPEAFRTLRRQAATPTNFYVSSDIPYLLP
jgi:hypothetical protein